MSREISGSLTIIFFTFSFLRGFIITEGWLTYLVRQSPCGGHPQRIGYFCRVWRSLDPLSPASHLEWNFKF